MKKSELDGDKPEIEMAHIPHVSPTIWITKNIPDGMVVHTELGVLPKDLLQDDDVRDWLTNNIKTKLGVEDKISFMDLNELGSVRMFSRTRKVIPRQPELGKYLCFPVSPETGNEVIDDYGHKRSPSGMKIHRKRLRDYNRPLSPKKESLYEDEWIEWEKSQEMNMIALLPEQVQNQVEHIRNKISDAKK